jgi:hypothetical protein
MRILSGSRCPDLPRRRVLGCLLLEAGAHVHTSQLSRAVGIYILCRNRPHSWKAPLRWGESRAFAVSFLSIRIKLSGHFTHEGTNALQTCLDCVLLLSYLQFLNFTTFCFQGKKVFLCTSSTQTLLSKNVRRVIGLKIWKRFGNPIMVRVCSPIIVFPDQ